MPKVSIIVPVYNVEAYLSECIESLRNQTLRDIEIILVDDESPDNCPKMCDAYAEKDSRIKVVHKKNGGLGLARNSGLEVATGEYVAFTDSDDYELAETYEKLYQVATASKCDVIYYRFVSNIPQCVDIKSFNKGVEINNLLLDMVGNPPEKAKDRDIQVSSCLGLYRREMFEQNQIRFQSERELISEDLIFNIDVLSCAVKVIVTDWQFYFYRATPGSLTHKIREDRHKMNKIFYQFLVDRLCELGFGYDGMNRSTRLFLGYTRSAILAICRANLGFNEKRERVLDICHDEVFIRIHEEYPYKKLPIKHRLFFECMYKKRFLMLWLMSKCGKS